MLKVVSFKICPFVQRVTAALEAKSITYDIEHINLTSKPQWFLDISPHGQVPLLITDSGHTLFESDAIVEYLDEVFPPLQPEISPEQRAIDRAWSYLGVKNYLVQCSAMRSADQETLKMRAEKLREIFAKAEGVMGAGPFFKGKAISNVDIAWLPLLHRADIIHNYTGYDFLQGFPKVQAWQKALMDSGVPNRSVARDFEVLFVDFYLSQESFLGRTRGC